METIEQVDLPKESSDALNISAVDNINSAEKFDDDNEVIEAKAECGGIPEDDMGTMRTSAAIDDHLKHQARGSGLAKVSVSLIASQNLQVGSESSAIQSVLASIGKIELMVNTATQTL